MLHPPNIEQQLGFARIRDVLKSLCLTSSGVKKCQSMPFMIDAALLDQSYGLLREAMEIRKLGFPVMLDFSGSENVLPQFRIEGNSVGPVELFTCLCLLESGNSWLNFLEKNIASFPAVYETSTTIALPTVLLEMLKISVDSDGNILDSASKDLSKIRKRIREAEAVSRKTLQKVYKEYVEKGWVPEGNSVSVKNGRSVIPIRAENKKKMNGYFQGESASGSIAYIEPEIIVELANEVMALRQAELREIQRILAKISAEAHDQLSSLYLLQDWLAGIDLLVAKTNFASGKSYVIPSRSSTTKIVDGYHPSLYDANKLEGKATIPLSLELSEMGRILVISGPNAGGKSVALKTVGIVQLMFQYGLPIPAEEGTELQLFEKIILDIGDNQSMENDLSTYSSHLLTMKTTLDVADSNCLFLFDEFGSGTAPRIGGAMGESVLEMLNKAGAYGVITTHYDNIKEFADNNEGVINAAMRFDVDKLKPLYEIEFGRPGSSFALEMARKSGLPAKILDRATELAGKAVVEMEVLLAKIQNQKNSLEKKEVEADKNLAQLKRQQDQYNLLNDQLKEKKAEILSKARDEASRLLSDANKEIEKTIRHIKTSKAHKSETQKVRKKFEAKKKQIDLDTHKAKETEPKQEQRDFKVGDRVKIIGHDTTGIVKSVSKKDAEVESGSITMKIKTSQLQFVEENEQLRRHQRSVRRLGIDMTSRKSDFRHELDLRGKRGDEAIVLVEKYLDDAVLLGANEVRVLHGKGDGILRKLVREQLKRHPQVEKYEDDHPDRGGAGITHVHLK